MSSSLVHVGELSYDRQNLIGRGDFGIMVFEGLFQNKLPVAIKRIMIWNPHEKEFEVMSRAGNHKNILRYFCKEITEDFL